MVCSKHVEQDPGICIMSTCLSLTSSLNLLSASLSFSRLSLTLGWSRNFCSAALNLERFSFTVGLSRSAFSASLALVTASFKLGFWCVIGPQTWREP